MTRSIKSEKVSDIAMSHCLSNWHFWGCKSVLSFVKRKVTNFVYIGQASSVFSMSQNKSHGFRLHRAGFFCVFFVSRISPTEGRPLLCFLCVTEQKSRISPTQGRPLLCFLCVTEQKAIIFLHINHLFFVLAAKCAGSKVRNIFEMLYEFDVRMGWRFQLVYSVT